MSQTAILDTDACIEIIRGNPAPIESLPDFTFVISSVTQFEILSGLKGRKGSKIEKRAKAFLKNVEIKDFNSTAASKAADFRIQLETKGTPIGSYDLLIAGHAAALSLPIVTGNEKEFRRIPELKVFGFGEKSR